MTSTSNNLKLAPGLAEFIQRFDSVMPPDFYTRPVESQRKLYGNLVREFHYDRPPRLAIRDELLQAGAQQLPIRIYRPEGPGPQPCLLYLHGGGFALGGMETHDTIMAEVAAKTGVTVIAVDYRLAPEHPFPAGLEDCYAALLAVAANPGRFDIDPQRLGVGGDSSGGNFAVGLSMMVRERGGPKLRAQVMISPVLDLRRWADKPPSSEPGLPLLSDGEMRFFTRTYLGPAMEVEHPYASPLLAGNFAQLPPAYIMGAEMDPLRIDGELYAERLSAAGVPVELAVEPGLVHACLRARSACAEVASAFDRFCAATRRLLAGEP
ncbi:alpha/beta hydrolase [Pyxidicoccus sp. MSG2]|uniref:alpha/beta hydrolase n=1 Tax=Pyxidicoccus sp. MSG2 TaxID=2996790 RepID=UPI00226E4F31|nr:alpha/beta hydrolase [Pyxidicoccus sp. MSG2]MCY1018665.1 alpha/beta hydrolase [Pyxidicoccus sp. MSG2]